MFEREVKSKSHNLDKLLNLTPSIIELQCHPDAISTLFLMKFFSEKCRAKSNIVYATCEWSLDCDWIEHQASKMTAERDDLNIEMFKATEYKPKELVDLIIRKLDKLKTTNEAPTVLYFDSPQECLSGEAFSRVIGYCYERDINVVYTRQSKPMPLSKLTERYLPKDINRFVWENTVKGIGSNQRIHASIKDQYGKEVEAASFSSGLLRLTVKSFWRLM